MPDYANPNQAPKRRKPVVQLVVGCPLCPDWTATVPTPYQREVTRRAHLNECHRLPQGRACPTCQAVHAHDMPYECGAVNYDTYPTQAKKGVKPANPDPLDGHETYQAPIGRRRTGGGW